MMTMAEELVITKHAYTRMKERNGWNKEGCYTYGFTYL